jgi:hypothetical protein
MDWNNPSCKVVSGVFDSDRHVESLLTTLEDNGYDNNDVSLLMSDKTRDRYPNLADSSKLPEGAARGGLTGGLLGALIGGLTLAGSVALPGVGLLLAGPIVGALTGGAVGASAGGLVGALVGAGIPEDEAKYYEESIKREGNILVLAHVEKGDVPEVLNLFKSHGAKDVELQRENEGARRDTPLYSKDI